MVGVGSRGLELEGNNIRSTREPDHSVPEIQAHEAKDGTGAFKVQVREAIVSGSGETISPQSIVRIMLGGINAVVDGIRIITDGNEGVEGGSNLSAAECDALSRKPDRERNGEKCGSPSRTGSGTAA